MTKKHFFLVLLFLAFGFSGMSQFSETPNEATIEKKDWNPVISTNSPDLAIYGTYGYQSYNRYNQNWMVGIAAEMGFADKWSANYRIQGGPDFFHFPAALPFATIIWSLSRPLNGFDTGQGFAKYLFLIPEGVSYSFEPFPGLAVKPYVNPLGITVLRDTDAQNISYWNAYMMLSIGSSVQLTALGRWGLSAYGEYRYSWNGERSGVQTGIRLNHNFELNNRWPFWN